MTRAVALIAAHVAIPAETALSTCLTCDGNSVLGGSGAVCGVQAASEDLVMSFQVAKRSAISVR